MDGAPKNLVGLTRDELAAEMAALGVQPFRARQLWHWIYHRGATDFAAMTTLAKDVSRASSPNATSSPGRLSPRAESADGTRKWLLRFADGQEAECVHIPEEDRGTLCVSSQSAAPSPANSATPARSAWCATSMRRDRGPGDARRATRWANGRRRPTDRQLTNIVLMGMGEPLYNYDEVAEAVKIVIDNEGLSVSRRKITLSTAGVVPMIRRCGEDTCRQSRHLAPRRDGRLRDVLVPLNKKYPLAELLDACRTYPGASNARRITFEYVMLNGVNDSPAEARAWCGSRRHPGQGQPVPFNPWPGAPFDARPRGDRGLLRHRQRRRLRLAGAHAHGPRHPGRVRAAQIRQHKTPRQRAAEARGRGRHLIQCCHCE